MSIWSHSIDKTFNTTLLAMEGTFYMCIPIYLQKYVLMRALPVLNLVVQCWQE